MLAKMIAKVQEYSDEGIAVRTATLIVTDGNDQHSSKYGAADCKALIQDLLAMEMHIVAGMGIDDGKTDFKAVFNEMGIEDKWILTPGDDAGEIRKNFAVFSKSASEASQNSTSFSQVAGGGFGA